MSEQRQEDPRRQAVNELLTRIVNDPGFRQQILNDPVGAAIAAAPGEGDVDEVTGYLMCRRTCLTSCGGGRTCSNGTCSITEP
jgi:hypothetical protein